VPVYLIPGEQDASFVELVEAHRTYRGAAPIYFVHRNVALLRDGEAVAGFGGWLTTAQRSDQLLLQLPAWEARMAFEYLDVSNPVFWRVQRRIFLFATPLRGMRIDLRDGQHIGIDMLNVLNRRYRPDVICCAGAPDGRGVERIDGALVVNPGSLADGWFALLDLDTSKVQFIQLPPASTMVPQAEQAIEAA
jgi:Icc-related predicted phosphoesterase